jgi:hypothetical protein
MLGRFMGMDPVGVNDTNLHSHNRYAYANNNPYRFVDRDGREAESTFKTYLNSQEFLDTMTMLNTAAVINEAVGAVGELAPAARVLSTEARVAAEASAVTARNALAKSLSPLKGKAPATVTGGYNIKTGEVAAKACGGGKCAENHVVESLGGVKEDVRFTPAIRPRTGKEVPVCPRCESAFGRGAFTPSTKFKTD